MKRPWDNWYVFKALLAVCKDEQGSAILTRAYAHLKGWGCSGTSSVDTWYGMGAIPPKTNSVN